MCRPRTPDPWGVRRLGKHRAVAGISSRGCVCFSLAPSGFVGSSEIPLIMRPTASNAIGDPDESCPCGSSRLGRDCCLDAQGRICGVPEAVPAPTLGSSLGNLGCYAAPLGGCSHQLSGEHYVSHAVLRRMMEGGGQLVLSKFPWLAEGVSKIIPPSQVKAKVLCTAHNSALSPYDTIGDRFCSLLLKAGHPAENCAVAALFNGEDLERWFLKTLCGVTAMEASVRGVRWHAPRHWLESLFKEREAMPSGAGLWLDLRGFWMFPDGAPSLSATPIDDPEGGSPWGLRLHFCGIEFLFLLNTARRSRYAPNGRLRPGLLSIESPGYCTVQIGIRYRYSPLGTHLRLRPRDPPPS